MINTYLMITLSFCAILWSLFRTWCYTKRSGKQLIDLIIIGKFILITCGHISNVFFIINICAAIYWLFIYKKQSSLNISLPSRDDERSLIIYVIIAFSLKALQLLHELYTLGKVNVFFIDWERPKKRDSSDVLSKAKNAIIIDKDASDVSLRGSSAMGSRGSVRGSAVAVSSGRIGNDKTKMDEFPNVTIWRSYFVANEWTELSGRRRINIAVHIMIVILILDVIGFSSYATSDTKNWFKSEESQRNASMDGNSTTINLQGNVNNTIVSITNVPINATCRMAMATLFYVSLAIIHCLFMKFVFENFSRNNLNEFVDLCSVSNISVFCMVYKQFGYYIHGRSANGRADVNIKEMHELLKREEDDLCSKRGLLPNNDQQTFQMSLPSAIFDHYQKLRTIISGYGQTNGRMRAFSGNLFDIDSEKVISTYLAINKFLSGFIEHSFKDVDYTVRDKSTLELIIDAEFYDVRQNGFFYNDNGHSFESVLYGGLEITVIYFELMLFIVIDLCFENFTCAGIFTYIISETIRRIYMSVSRKNIVRKALIDERFLI